MEGRSLHTVGADEQKLHWSKHVNKSTWMWQDHVTMTCR